MQKPMQNSAVDVLFQPFKIKSLSLKNRIVMAPMTRSFSPQGIPGINVADYYERRAFADVGLIISEGTVIDRPAAKNHPDIPLFHSEVSLAGWKRVIDKVHAAGGKMAPQIWHVGSVASPMTDWVPTVPVESPSGLVAPGKPRGEVISLEAIADTIASFARAAADAKRLGFDVVEIHGAHGYLIDQFFWDATNTRTDQFGGATLKERSHFAAEVVKAVRRAVGPDYPIILRVSQWKQQDYNVKLADSPAAMADWLVPLVEAGADILHCSQRRFWEPEFPSVDGDAGLNFAGWAKKLTGAVTISVGSVGLSGDMLGAFAGESSQPASLEHLVERMQRNEFDLIAVGRALLSDPQWVTKIRAKNTQNLRDFNAADFGQLV
jgi:2,4-dienoyl-CoA reductase-like NADH-dependent reductase (Old Yellow Enzyme family)